MSAPNAPTLPEIMETLQWFASSLRLVHNGRPLPTPGPESVKRHIAGIDAALTILGSLHVSPGAKIILSELGYTIP